MLKEMLSSKSIFRNPPLEKVEPKPLGQRVKFFLAQPFLKVDLAQPFLKVEKVDFFWLNLF
jgi:hypothetical protein